MGALQNITLMRAIKMPAQLMAGRAITWNEEMITEKPRKHTRCKSCGDLMKDEAHETYCKTCLGYSNAWIHIQRVKECLEGLQ